MLNRNYKNQFGASDVIEGVGTPSHNLIWQRVILKKLQSKLKSLNPALIKYETIPNNLAVI